MTVRELAQVLRAAPQGDAPQEPLDVNWLAGALSSLPGVLAARVFVARTEPADEYRESTEVWAAGDFVSVPGPGSLGNLRFFGRPAVLGDRTRTVHERFTGPHESDPELSADRVCLLVRVRTPHTLAWFLVYAAKDSQRLGDTSAWCDGLYAVVEQSIPAPDAPIGRRRRFVSEIAKYRPVSPEADFAEVCRAWRTALRADAAGLWLSDRNDQDRSYELAAFDPREGRPEMRVPTGMTRVGQERLRAAGHFACRYQKGPLWIPDVETWREQRDEEVDGVPTRVTYVVRLREVLLRMGYRTLLLIPLRAGQARDDEYASLMALHYRDQRHEHLHDHEILDVMGQLTAKMIALSQEHEQHDILMELNRIAGRYLGEPGRLSALRPVYVNEVIELIRKRLRVELASVFYKSRFDPVIECSGTTGIWDVRTQPGRKVPPDAIASVRYELADTQRNTVRCFVDHEAIVTKEGDKDVLYSERGATGERPKFDPTVYVPIPDPLAQGKPASIGVLRCYGHKSAVFANEYASYDHVDLSTLKFIAEQIAPILKIFEYRMLKEQAVISTKHDLYFPTRMGRDAINRLIADFESARPLRRVDLSDLRTTLGAIQNMIGVLDPEPEKRPELKLRPTLLEGDIVGRLRDMLQPLADERKMDIRYEGFRDIPALELDPDQIERAIFNLVVNGIKYGKRGTEIWIEGAVRDDPPFYEIDVSNEGPGIPDNVRPEDLFLPGYRTPEARKVSMGQGLGLTIARAAVRAHGGELILARRRDPTIFRVQLPTRLRGKP